MITLIRASNQEELRSPMFVGLSTDGYPDNDNPAMMNGARIYQMDTKATYEYSQDDDGWHSVPTNGGGGDIPADITSGVKFVDYDGTVVKTWSSDSVASKTALPDNPTHEGLIAQGWSLDLEHIQNYIANYPNTLLTVGQMYKTDSGLTEIDITVTKVTGKTVTCAMSGNKNWGDGTAQDTATTHTYANYGSYTITCDGTSIPFGTSSSGGMFKQTSSNNNRYWCTGIRIGGNVTSIGNYAFNYCYPLTTVTIPKGLISIGKYAFSECYSLITIIIPDSVTSVGEYAFNANSSLRNIAIPENITSINTAMLNNCISLTFVAIPSRATSIGDQGFFNCRSLTSFIIPSGVTSINAGAFHLCASVMKYDFTALTSVPALLYTNAFASINGLCKIVVPDALYNEWIVATNWATYANYIYKASEVIE